MFNANFVVCRSQMESSPMGSSVSSSTAIMLAVGPPSIWRTVRKVRRTGVLMTSKSQKMRYKMTLAPIAKGSNNNQAIS